VHKQLHKRNYWPYIKLANEFSQINVQHPIESPSLSLSTTHPQQYPPAYHIHILRLQREKGNNLLRSTAIRRIRRIVARLPRSARPDRSALPTRIIALSNDAGRAIATAIAGSLLPVQAAQFEGRAVLGGSEVGAEGEDGEKDGGELHFGGPLWAIGASVMGSSECVGVFLRKSYVK
jgi:hypothetical protein